MFHCNAGNILIVNAFYEEDRDYFFDTLGLNPYVRARIADNSGRMINIPHGELVMALEKSVPPWYKSDRIRCLWFTREVHILRLALVYHERNYKVATEILPKGSV